MVKKGKIKFSTLNNNRGVKTDFFRVVEDAKDKKGDWQIKAGFPEQLTELEFYFPFEKMENNVKIAYSGFCNLPSGGRGSQEKSYFVVSEGIGCPLVAIPQGHNGITYDGTKNEILLTEERLAKWRMVKKRMTVFLTPKGWLPHEYIVWHTTSEIAISSFIQEYIDLSTALKDNLSLIPLVFKSIGKSGKNASGQQYRFFHGSISFHGDLHELLDAHNKAKELRKALNIKLLEEDFEAGGFFNDIKNEEEATEINPDTGEIIPSKSSPAKSSIDLLEAYVNKPQANKLIELAVELGAEEDLLSINSTANALSLLNKLQSRKNAA